MLENILPREDLATFARSQARDTVTKSVRKEDLEAATEEGWSVVRRSKRRVRLAKPKKKPDLLESRVWSMLYRLGFSHMSGNGGASLAVSAATSDGPSDQIDVVAVDGEAGLCVECKTFESERKDNRFSERLARLSLIGGAGSKRGRINEVLFFSRPLFGIPSETSQ